MRISGLVMCGLLFAVPLLHFGPLLLTKNLDGVVSQYLGLVSYIAMAQIMVLATRWPFVESVFGGLDRVYVLHKWLGITAIAAAFLHESLDAEINGLEIGSRLDDFAESVGEFSYNTMLVLVAITLLTFIPYHWWRQTHKLMGAVFGMMVFHAWFIEKSFANTSFMGQYISALGAIGLIAYVYTLLPVKWLRRMREFKIAAVEDTGDAVSIYLKPVVGPIDHKAGQFAFLRPEGAGHSEVHPFTISQGPNPEELLRFTVKPLGDGTQKLVDLVKSGQSALVSQPFGHFRHTKPMRPQLWIAGGIGITPFLAWASDLPEDHGSIDLLICCRNREDVAHLNEFEAVAAANSEFRIHIYESSRGMRLTANYLMREFPNFRNCMIAYCGPEGLREALRKTLLSAGVTRDRFLFEEFKIRSGLPMTLLWNWVIDLFARWQRANVG